jgi:tetratricopeptide (TPR) repeat protein
MIGMQGRLDEAIAEFRRALELAPSAPHILSNLGYALTLQGRASEAVPLLQRAASLDSGNTRISVNLGLATSKVEKAVAPTAPIEPASKPEKGPAIASAPSEIEEPYASEQMRAASGPELALQTRRGGDGYRLEIANGMGFSGAAAKVAEWLARDGAPSAQLRNKRPFGERTTVIYFSRGFEQQGQRLATGLGIPSVPVREAQLSSSDIRIEIGSDMLPLLMADGVRAGI